MPPDRAGARDRGGASVKPKSGPISDDFEISELICLSSVCRRTCGRRAVFAGGLRGADNRRSARQRGHRPAGLLHCQHRLVLEEMARRSLIPVVAGLSPMDAVDLVHAEAQHIGKRLAARAVADGRNLLLDVTMGSQPSVQSRRPRTLRNLGPESLAKHRSTADTGHAWRNPASC